MDFRPSALILAALAALATPALQARSAFSWEELNTIDQKWPQAHATTTGLRYVVLREGKGELPRPGETVRVLYTGTFFDGRKFDQAIDPAKPFSFRLGRGEVIAGWDEGVGQMRVGEKRILIVPYDLAYGWRGQPPRIARQTSLVFEVELLAIEANPVPPPAAPGAAR